jgi:C-terminal processing protease CtpA/Prc
VEAVAEAAQPSDKPYYSKYEPNERFMMTVANEDDCETTGISFVLHKTELFVTGIEKGPFVTTALERGDKILSINGKKPPKQIKSVEQAEEIMAAKPKITLFAMRPDPKKDRGYQWVMANT